MKSVQISLDSIDKVKSFVNAVNRLDGESKDFGSIVDYKQLFGELSDAVNTYTAEAYFSARREGLQCGRIINAIKLIPL